MSSLLQTIIPKSDQLNADDLIGGPITIRITRVAVKAGAEQPVAISYENDGGKPYKPGLTMRRLLVLVWGGDPDVYAGRRLTLYRDDTVRFGGAPVGGIRISHVSDFPETKVFLLTDKRGSRRPHTIKPLPPERATDGRQSAAAPLNGAGDSDRQPPPAEDNRTKLLRAARAKAGLGTIELDGWLDRLSAGQRKAVDEIEAELRDLAADADDRPPLDDDFPGFAPNEGEAA